jgi:SAM-dependent methyltransferase
MQILAEARDPGEARAALGSALAALPGDEARRIEAVRALWEATPGAFDTVKAVLARVTHDEASEGDPVARWAAMFDRAAEADPGAGSALYALGDPDLLARATAEVVGFLRSRGLLGPATRAVEIGCGAGRFLAALAGEVGEVTGFDVSPRMIAAARERCAALPNVRFVLGTGRSLAEVPDGSADLVLAADSFPYLVHPDPSLAEAHVAEAARILRHGGALAILNYSYRGDPALDRADVARLGAANGFTVEADGARPFGLWDGTAFVLRRG